MTYEPTELVRRAWQNPPRCLRAFSVRALQKPKLSEEPWDELAVFRASCRCGGQLWRVHGHPDSDAEFVCPFSLECIDCGELQMLFDAAEHGYDAEIDGECTSIRGSGEASAYRCDSCAGSRFEVLPSFSYQIEPIDDLGEEIVARIEDFFDGFGLDLICERCARQACIASYECA